MEHSLSQHDVEHRFVATGDWQLPFGRERRFGSGVSRGVDAVIVPARNVAELVGGAPPTV